MNEWPTATLGDLCVSLEDGDWIETKDQGGDDYRLLQVGNIGVGSFRETGKYRYVARETFDRLRCREIKVGDILVSRMPDPVGRAWHVKRSMPWKAITAVDVAIVSPNPRKLDAAFCAYFLNSPQNLDYAAARAGGTTRLRITRRDLATFPIPVPPLAEQRRIALILSAYDELIENNTRRVAILEEMARRIYEEWFVHFRFPGHEHVKTVDSELGPVPEGWGVRTLQSVCVPEHGIQTGPFGSQLHKSDYAGQGVPVPMPKDLVDFRIETRGIARIPNDTAERLSRHRMQAGDIVYGRRGDIGRRAYVMADQVGWLCGTGCLRLRPDSGCINGWYLFNHLGQDNVAGLIAGRAHGATMPNLNAKLMESVPIMCPPWALQDQFETLTFPMIGFRELLNKQNTNLRTTCDLLLPKLISGELDVSALSEPEVAAA